MKSKKIVRSLAWSSVELWGRQSIAFLVFLILSRLLGPDAFGLLALASIFIFLGETFTNFGFGTAIVQRKTTDPVLLSTAFWIGVSVGLALTLLGFVLAEPIALLFNEPRLAPILRVLSFQFAFGGLSILQEALLQRDLAFKSLAARANLATLVSGAVGIVMAFAGYGVWSLVAQRLVAVTVGAAVLWTASDWRPQLVFSRADAKTLLSFGAPVLGYNLLGSLNQQFNQFLIGYFLGTVALGYYVIGFRILSILLRLLTNVTTRVALPAFSKLQDDLGKLRGAFLTATRLTSLFSFPVFVGLAVVTPELIPALFGAQWLPSVPVTRVLALAGVIQSVFYFNATVIVALGRPGVRLLQLALHIAVNLALFFLVYRWGLTAITIAYVARAYLLAPFDIWLVRRLTKVRIDAYLAQFRGPLVGTLLMAAAIVGVKILVGGPLSQSLALPLYIVVGMVSYMAGVALLAPELFRTSLGLARALFSRAQPKEAS